MLQNPLTTDFLISLLVQPISTKDHLESQRNPPILNCRLERVHWTKTNEYISYLLCFIGQID